MGGQRGKEVSALPTHRTARVRLGLSLCVAIKHPLTGKASQGGAALHTNPKAGEGSGQARFSWEQARGCTSMCVSRLEHVGTIAV